MLNLIPKTVARLIGANSCEDVNDTVFSKNCLLLYILEPFKAASLSINHQNQWQARELARIIGEFGYNVDVIRFDSSRVRLTKKYDLVIDIHPGLNDCYKSHMTESCLKIAYITGSNPKFANHAEDQRLADLFRRRGVQLKPRRHAKCFLKTEIESFDAFFFIGNDYNLRTYEELKLPPVYFIRNTGVCRFPELGVNGKAPADFLFLGSGGQVHKGLDLLLEAFACLPKLNLFVCSSFKRELDFCRAYRQELFRSKNIHPVGFISTDSVQFREICQRCSYVILPSCSEANAGSVLTAMAAGLIPIVSRECGFSENEVHYLDDCKVETIASTVEVFSRRDLEWIGEESRRVKRVVAERYSMDNYTESVRMALEDLLGNDHKQER